MKEGYIEKSVASREDINLISQFARRELSPEEIYTFNVNLCNNDIDRDFEKFSVSALEQMAELFVGKTGIFDHSMKAGDQKARIYATNLERVEGKKTADGEDFYTLKAKAYMLNNDNNKSLIDEIDAGIKKEVSVSCSVNKAICSICGADKRKERCQHIQGKTYDDKLCFSILEDATDAYEFSFVAVPAQREAGITKSFDLTGEQNMVDIIKRMDTNESITLSKSEVSKLHSYIEDLEEEAKLADDYKKELSKKVIELFKSAFPNMDTKLFASITSVMTTKELLGFCDGMKKQNSREKTAPQLAVKPEANKNNYSEFRI